MSPERTVYVQDQDLLDPTGEAMAAWNDKLARTCPAVRLVLTTDPDADIKVAWGKLPGPRVGQEHSHTAYHDSVPGVGPIAIRYDQGDITIYPLDGPTYQATLPAVIGHELGHALGWDKPEEHSTDPDDLMHAPVKEGRGPEPTTADVHRVCQFWGAGAP